MLFLKSSERGRHINIWKEISVNPGNLTQEKELTKIGYRQGENGKKKKRERERKAKLTTAKSIEFK